VKAQRTDFLKLDGMETTAQGFLRFPVFMGRTGVQIYRKADGSIVKEFRPPEEVFREETMAGLRGIPVTNNHPSSDVTPENFKDLAVGYGSDQVDRIDGEGVSYQRGFVTIADAQAIRDIQDGKVEVSLGYDVAIDETPGDYNGLVYDVIQRNITPNHLALVDKGRAGSEVRLRLDSEDAVMVNDNDSCKPFKEDLAMEKIKIGDKEYEVSKEAKDAIQGMLKEKDSELEKMKSDMEGMKKEKSDMEGEKKSAEEKADSLEAKVDGLTADLEKAKGQRNDADILKLVKERKFVEKVAERVLDEESVKKIDSIDDTQEIKRMVIKTEFPEADLADKSSAYVNARFDHLAESLDKSSEENNDAGKAFQAGRKDKKDEGDLEKKRQDRQEKIQNAWQEPIGKSRNS